MTGPGERDRNSGGHYTSNIEEVIRRVVFDGWSVRARGIGPEANRGDSLGLRKRSFHRYWVAPEFRALVAGAATPPLADLPIVAISQENGESRYAMLDTIDSSRFEQALLAVELKMSAAQRAMLVGHAYAPKRIASMRRLAEFGGYDDFKKANLQYGRLGRLVAAELGVTGLANKTQALATGGNELDEHGHWQWQLRDNLAEALENLGWIEPLEDLAFERVAAEAEISADPSCADVSETTRRALINARIGQGGFKRRMALLWKGRCAVTRCDIDAVLVASHAKSWRDSTNAERLDEYNGLYLAASVDRLFDRGLISFSNTGELLVAAELENRALESVGLLISSTLSKVHARNQPFLRAHRGRFGFA